VGYKDKQAFVRSFTGDISTGGLFIITENPMAQGDRFVLKLHLPKLDTPLNIESEVAWSRMREGREDPRPVGMGVKFLRMDPREAQRLKAYLTGLNPQSS
jgi:uncharacterized protein (TIGR02266 family)